MPDPYLAKVVELEKKLHSFKPHRDKGIKDAYRTGKEAARHYPSDQGSALLSKQYDEFPAREKGLKPRNTAAQMGYANALVGLAQRQGDFNLAEEAMRIYEWIGQGYRPSVKRKLIRVAEEGIRARTDPRHPWAHWYVTESSRERAGEIRAYIIDLEKFCRKNPTRSNGRIESFALPSFIVLGIAFGFLIATTTITGYSVTNSSNGRSLEFFVAAILLVSAAGAWLYWFRTVR